VEAHRKAVNNGHFTYDDPITGLKVMTRLRHHLKGTCCGSACRHCVYNHEAIPYELRGAKRFNSSFWVDADTDSNEAQETEKDEAIRVEEEKEDEVSNKEEEGPPPLPTTCCMSGCANCVWLDYADAMVAFYSARGEGVALQDLLITMRSNVEDPMVKTFIEMELKSKYRTLRQ